MTYALLIIEPLRFLRTVMEGAAQAALSLNDLSFQYRHALKGDLYRITVHEGCATEDEANRWLIKKAATMLDEWIEVIEVDDDVLLSLKPGMKASDFRWEGDLIHPNSAAHDQHLKSPFDPLLELGTFAENIRIGRDSKDLEFDELRDSMRTFGWIDHHPAIIDERGVILVGHRRLAVAKELGIAPKTVTVDLGRGDAADAQRLGFALASNLGGRPLQPSDRKKIAERLYQGEWTMTKIAEMLRVSQRTISEDLKGLEAPLNLTRPKGGRPPGSKNKSDKPYSEKLQKALDAYDRLVEAEKPLTEKALMKEAGISATPIRRAVAIRETEARLRKEETTDPIAGALLECIQELIRTSPVPLTTEAAFEILSTAPDFLRRKLGG